MGLEKINTVVVSPLGILNGCLEGSDFLAFRGGLGWGNHGGEFSNHSERIMFSKADMPRIWLWCPSFPGKLKNHFLFTMQVVRLYQHLNRQSQ